MPVSRRNLRTKKNAARKRRPKIPADEGEIIEVTATESFGACRCFLKVCILLLTSLVVLLSIAYLTSPTQCKIIDDSHDSSTISWGFMNNSDLVKGKRILHELLGPESIAVDGDGAWYTGLHDGRLVKIQDGLRPTVVHTTKMPDFSEGKRSMRRPLGLRLHKRKLYVVDGYQGLFSVDIDDWKWDKIVGYDDVTPAMFFPDDLTVSKDGKTIYLTDASARWMYDEAAFSLVESECSGRIFKIDLPSKVVTEVRGSLCFPNGIQLNYEENHLLVSENARKRVTVIDAVSGETIKQVLLHGGPDNIRPSISGGYWVALPSIPDSNSEYTNNYPFVRDILAKLLGQEGLIKLTNLDHGTVVKLNEDYEITSVHYDRDGEVCGAITEVQELDDGRILLGTFLYHGIVTLSGMSN